jgi:prefoldin subunit 5
MTEATQTLATNIGGFVIQISSLQADRESLAAEVAKLTRQLDAVYTHLAAAEQVDKTMVPYMAEWAEAQSAAGPA